VVFQVLLQKPSERLLEEPAAPAGWEQSEAEARLERSDARDPDGFGGLAINRANAAARAGCPRSSGKSFVRPILLNRAAMRDPSLRTRGASFLAARRRI